MKNLLFRKYIIIRTIFFLLALFILLSYAINKSLNIYPLIAVIAVFLGIEVFGVFNIKFAYFTKTLCSNKEIEHRIALTFDDGPHPEITPAVLDILKKHRIKATFFSIGKNVDKYPDLLKQIDSDGHLIGNHTFSHNSLFGFFPDEFVENELEKCETSIKSAIEKKTKLFRPPFGVMNPAIARNANFMNYKIIGWSLRSYDTMIKDEQKLFDRLTKKIKSGDVILVHDNREITLRVLPRFIQYCNENNFKFVRIDELFGIEAYENDV